jgi:hypothetical protein
MTIRYRMHYPFTQPVAVECAVVGYPNVDAEGFTQFGNSHFDNEADCWTALAREAEAAVSLSTRAVREHRKMLAKLEAELVEVTLALDDIRKAKAATP